MKVLLVSTLYYPREIGGAERMVKRLADALPAHGVVPEVVCLSDDSRDRSDVVDGIAVHRIPLRNVYPLFPAEKRRGLLKPVWHAIDSTNPLMVRAFAAVMRRVVPDLVHTHNVTGFSPSIWGAAARDGIPIVHTIHDYYLLCARATMFDRGQRCRSRHVACAMYSGIRTRHARHVAAVVGVSDFALRRHVEAGAFAELPRQRLRVIHNPIATEPVTHASRRDGPLRIGYLGRLDPPKGIELLIDACNALPGDWSLRIAGDGVPDYAQALRKRAVAPAIQFAGHVEPAGFLRDIDVLVLPSRWHEPLPLVIVEAFAAGVPVVGARLGGIPELVEDGRTGFLVDADSSDALRAVLASLTGDPARVRDLRAGCLAAAEAFVPARVAGSYARLYREVVAD